MHGRLCSALAIASTALVLGVTGGASASPAAGPPAAPVTHTIAGNGFTISCTTASTCFALTQQRQKSRWAITKLANKGASAHTTLLSKNLAGIGISCPSKAGCEVVANNVAKNQPVIFAVSASGKPGKPRAVHVSAGWQFTEIACHASRSHCTLIGAQTNTVFITTVNGASTSTHHFRLHNASIVDMQGLSCPTASYCEAGGLVLPETGSNRGLLVAIHHGKGVATAVNADSNSGIVAVACPGATTCYAVGSPLSGSNVLYTLNNAKIRHSKQLPTGLTPAGIACPAAHNCDVVGNVVGTEVREGAIVPVRSGSPGSAQLTTVTIAYFAVAGVHGGLQALGEDPASNGTFKTIVSAH